MQERSDPSQSKVKLQNPLCSYCYQCCWIWSSFIYWSPNLQMLSHFKELELRASIYEFWSNTFQSRDHVGWLGILSFPFLLAKRVGIEEKFPFIYFTILHIRLLMLTCQEKTGWELAHRTRIEEQLAWAQIAPRGKGKPALGGSRLKEYTESKLVGDRLVFKWEGASQTQLWPHKTVFRKTDSTHSLPIKIYLLKSWAS